jgi:branched-chain amino acid transport system substrate-binding protein
MAKVVVFDIGDGSFENGFPVTLSINEEGKPTYFIKRGKLPPAPEIPKLYSNFQQIYRNLPRVQRIITVDPGQPTNFSTSEECKSAANALEESLRIWYVRTDMIQLRQWVQEEVNIDEPARVIFQTDDNIIKKLPLHQWELFHNRPSSWLALGADNAKPSSPLKIPIRILTVLGNAEGLNIDIDTELLNQLPGGKVEILRNTTRKKLCDTLRIEDDPWDIFYFAGHSSSKQAGNDGVIQISDIDSLSLGDLRNAFKKAIQNGLKLAIFNSCDGLGLANRLVKLGIPQVIVMREPVPDEVAHEFLQEFLRLFSQGERFNLAVRQAQEKLEDIENDYPCASWLPIICQNPAENSLLWPQPLVNIVNFQKLKRKIRMLWHRRKWASIIIIGLMLGAFFSMFNIISKNIDNNLQAPHNSAPTPVTATAIPSPPKVSALNKFFSQGENLLLTKRQNTTYKLQGIAEFEMRQWNIAIPLFAKSLKQNKNDPETLIYLNNAIAKKSGNYLSIAVAVPISANPDGAEEILRGVAHAQTELNCNSVDNIKNPIDSNNTPNCTGNIKGKSLLVQIVNESDTNYDSASYKSTIVEVAKEIVNREEILAVIGHNGSANTIAAVTNGYQDELVVISPTSTSNELDNLQYLTYRTAPSDSSTAEILSGHVNTKLAKSSIKAVVAYDSDDSYSKSLKEAFKSYTPQKEYQLESDMFRSDFNPTIFTEAAKSANVVLLIPSINENILNKALEVVRKVSETTNAKRILLSADTMYDSKTIRTNSQESNQNYGEIAQKSNLVIAVPWHRSDSGFENEAGKLWPFFQISWRTVMAYDAMKAIIQGLQYIPDLPNTITREDSQDPITRANLKTQFSKMLKNQNIATGASDPVRFTDKGSRRGIGVLVKIECVNKIPTPVCNFEKVKI